MAATRAFGGAAGINHSAGTVDPTGAFTYVAVVDPSTAAATQYVLSTVSSGGSSGVRLSNTGTVTVVLDGIVWGPATNVTYTAAEGWMLIAITKAAGTAQFRIHKYLFTGATWSRQTSTSSYASPTGAPTAVRHGHLSSSNYLSGDLAATAVYGYEMSDAQVTALVANLDAWVAAGPQGMWVFDQASVTAVNDVTGHGADQSGTVGTTTVSGNAAPIEYIPAGEALAFRTGGATQGFGSTSSVVLTIPATVKTGDQMIIAACYKQLTGSGTLNTPAGWTQQHAPVNGPTGNSFQGAVYVKTAAGTAGQISTEAGTTVTLNATAGSQQLSAAFASYAGVSSIRSSSWVVGSTTSSTTLTAAAPGTGAQSGDLVVYLGAVRETVNGPTGQPTFTPAGGDGTIRAQTAGTSGSAQNVAAFIGDDDSTNATRTVTASQTSVAITGQIVLIPATVALTRATSETLTAADSTARAVALPRALAEALTLGNAMSVGVVLARAQAETLTAGNALAATSAHPRGTAEAITVADALAATSAHPRGTGEALTVAAALAGTCARPRGTAEALTVADALAGTSAHPRGTAEAITVADALTRAATGYSRAVGETLALGNALAAVSAKARATAEALTLGNAIAATSAKARAQAEAVAVGDAAAAIRALGRGVAQSLTVSDAWGYTVGRAIGVAEAVNLADGWARQLAAPRPVAQSLTLANSITTGTGVTIVVLEDLTLGDGWARQVADPRGMGGALSIDAAFAPTVALGVDVAEALTVAESWFAGMVVLVGVAEAISVADTAGVDSVAYVRDAGETLTLGHSFAR